MKILSDTEEYNTQPDLDKKQLLSQIHKDMTKYRRDKKVIVVYQEDGKIKDYYFRKHPSVQEGEHIESKTLHELASELLKSNPQLITSFQTLYEATGYNIKEFADYFHIPLRTVEDWSCEKRKPTDYLLDLMYYKLKNEKIL